MRTTFGLALVALTLTTAAPAAAWDGDGLWERDASGAVPGGGGLWGTGGRRDHGVHCGHCHMSAPGLISLGFTFTPALGTVGTVRTYQPGQTYQVDAQLTGETLGFSGCGAYGKNNNNFAAAIEDGTGATAGTYATDGAPVMTSAACSATLPASYTGTTITYGDCHAVASHNTENRTAWRFTWTAPAAGRGTLTLSYGAVDGNCDMMSMGDDVAVGALTLAEAGASLAPARPRAAGRQLAAVIGIVALGLAAWWRRRRG
ncbi:MAG TPA: hypothetical protein VGQ83_30675 [Polyangia bacterium]|jgi:hypothetical protein